MAGFRTHITTSSVLGVGYGTVGFFYLDVPLPTAVLAGGLCGVSGMLPDLDSDSGIPLRESVAFAAAVVPMLMFERFEVLFNSREMVALAGALVYLLIRFGLAALLKKYTVHRGMFHSIPAAIIAAEVAYLLCITGGIEMRVYKAMAVFAGFMSHLILDEIWSLYWYRGRLRVKSSFGTAVKLWSKSTWANLSTYAKLAILTFVVFHDHQWMHQMDTHPNNFELMVQSIGHSLRF